MSQKVSPPLAAGPRAARQVPQHDAEARFVASQEAALYAFTILRAVRDVHGAIVDFEWEYVNPAAGRLLKRDPGTLVGKRLLVELPNNQENSDLFARYVQVVETGRPHDYELRYEGESITGWFRNMCVRIGDGVAIAFTDVTEQVEREARLKASIAETQRLTEELRESDQRKDCFLAALAHELRNPLAPLVNAVELLKSADDEPPLRVRALATMERQLGTLIRLVDDLLDVNRISRDHVDLHREPLDVMHAVHDAVETCAPAVARARHTLETTVPDVPCMVYGDRVRLGQAFSNLLSNACRYTPEGGHIQLTVRSDGDAVEVAVSDSGVGLDPSSCTSVFELFRRSERSIAQVPGGLGIGLWLVRRLVELHGGTVWAESEGAGRGSRFTIRLPRFATASDNKP